MMRQLLFVVCVLSVSGSLSAQTVLGPSPVVEFTASADHSGTTFDGQAIVASYELAAIGMNGSGAIAVTVNLAKPTPNGSNVIVASVPQLSTITPNVVYTATVSAVGPGGAGVSAPSNPFGRAVLVPPVAPVNVSVR